MDDDAFSSQLAAVLDWRDKRHSGESIRADLASHFRAGYVVADWRDEIVYIDRAACSSLGISGAPVDWLGASTQLLFDRAAANADPPDSFREIVAHARASRVPELGRRTTFAHGGLVEVDCMPLFAAGARSGTLWRLRAHDSPGAIDSTQLKISLIAASKEWRTTFDAISAVVVRLDAEHRVSRANARAHELAHVDARDLVGVFIGDIAAGEPWSTAAAIVSLDDRPHLVRDPAVLDGSDGRTWDLTVTRLDGGADLVFARDITSEVRLQEEARLNERLAALGSLVGGVAHEVRNPLFAISATVDGFELRFGDRPEYGDHIEVLRAQVGRVNALMHDLLDYGRPRAPGSTRVDVVAPAEFALEQVRALGAERHVLVRPSIERDLPDIVGDASLLGQVFRNVLENAVQHSRPESAVDFSVAAVKRLGEALVQCRVRDTGPGVELEHLPRLFDPFFTRRRGGTGLGLAIVQRIVVGLGGRVVASNHADGGLEVVVEFPVPAA